jgi:serine/threonine-protein kinase RsbW
MSAMQNDPRSQHSWGRSAGWKAGPITVENKAETVDRSQKPCWKTRAMKGPDRPQHLGDFRVQQLVLSFDKVIPSDLSLLDDAVTEITAAIERTACWDDVETIGLAVREAIANAIVHGNHCDPEKTVRVSVSVNESCGLLIIVKDSGSGFDISRLPDPTTAENLLADHGRGIFLVKQFMEQVDFNFDHGTEVHMRRRRRWLE